MPLIKIDDKYLKIIEQPNLWKFLVATWKVKANKPNKYYIEDIQKVEEKYNNNFAGFTEVVVTIDTKPKKTMVKAMAVVGEDRTLKLSNEDYIIVLCPPFNQNIANSYNREAIVLKSLQEIQNHLAGN